MSLSRLPRVTIVVTTYLSKTYPYLRLCMDSIKNLNYPASELDVVLCCHQLDYRQYKVEFGKDGVNVVTPPEMEYNNARGLNFGVACAAEGSKYYFLLNDDVILSKNSLMNLVKRVGDNQVIASPISQCDQGRQFNLVMGIARGEDFLQFEKTFYRLPEVEHMTQELMNAESIYPPGFIFTPFLCLFAGFIPKTVWDKIGKLEEGFLGAGPDDLDFSLRGQQLGIRCAFVLDSFVFHFGGTSADSSVNIEKRIYNTKFFKSKWGFFPPGATEESLAKMTEKDYQYAVPQSKTIG